MQFLHVKFLHVKQIKAIREQMLSGWSAESKTKQGGQQTLLGG